MESRERGISKQQVERYCERSRLINNIRRKTHLGPALSAEREIARSSDEVFINSQFFPDTHYLMQTPTRLLDAKRNSMTRREHVVPRRVLVPSTNLHLARRQMSLCNQNYLSIQEPLLRFCVFRPPSLFPLRLGCSPFLFKFHLAE